MLAFILAYLTLKPDHHAYFQLTLKQMSVSSVRLAANEMRLLYF